MKQILIICFSVLLMMLHLGCTHHSKEVGKFPVSQEQYSKDKKQIADYILKNVEHYRVYPEICDSLYRGGTPFWQNSMFIEIGTDELVPAPIPASRYLTITVDTIVYDKSGTKCFIFCAITTKKIILKKCFSCRKDRSVDAEPFVGVRNTISDSLTIYPFDKFHIFDYPDVKEATTDLEYYFFHQLKGDHLLGSHYQDKGFEQNVDDPDFFEKSIIFQKYDDSTFNYQYCDMNLIRLPYMK